MNNTLVLRPFLESHYSSLISWVDSPQLLLLFSGNVFQYPLTVQQLQHNLSDPKRTAFLVLDALTLSEIGYAESYRVDDHTVKLARILIRQSHRGRGYGHQLLRTLLHFSFDEPQIQKVILRVFDHNKAAVQCYTKWGFLPDEGTVMMHHIENEIWNSVPMVLTAEKWHQLNKAQWS